MANPRIFEQQQLAYFPHTDVSGDTWTLIKKGTCTTSGAAGGTTLIDTNGDSSGADAYNGKYWVKILSGVLKGEWCRVVDDSGAGTLTFEDIGFQAQVASGVEYEIWKSPQPVCVVISSSGATDMVDTARTDEVNGFWVGYWVVPLTGSRLGEMAQVTAFTQSSGTFVLGTGLSGALAAGDVCELLKFVEAGSINDGTTEAYVERPQGRVNFAEGDGVVANRGGTLGFQTQITPSGSLAASGSKANASVLSGLLVAAGLEESIGTSIGIGAGSSTTDVAITTGSWENFAIGQMVGYNGEWRRITALTDGGGSTDTVTVSPAFSIAAASGGVLYASRMYMKSTSGDLKAVGFKYECDGVRSIMTGCKGNVVMQPGPVPMLAFTYQVDHYVEEAKRAVYYAAPAYTTTAPVKEMDRQFWLDTTATDVGGFTASPNVTATPKNIQGSSGINGRSGFQHTKYACGATFREILDTATELPQQLRWTVRTAKAMLMLLGGHGSMFACTIPVARLKERPKKNNASGILDVPNVVAAQDAGHVTGTSPVTTQKNPDFAFHLS